MIYLENFAPDEARERFEERIRSLFETKWIIELVDMAMLKIREYPDKGALYCEIISKAYLNRFKYKESEMLEVLNMERSTYYDRKKEAILLFLSLIHISLNVFAKSFVNVACKSLSIIKTFKLNLSVK